MEGITASPKLLVALIFSFTGLILSIIGILNYLKAKNSITWPTAVGTILTTDVKKETSSSSNNGTVTTYKPERRILASPHFSLLQTFYIMTLHYKYDRNC
jgi:hypothetical protein